MQGGVTLSSKLCYHPPPSPSPTLDSHPLNVLLPKSSPTLDSLSAQPFTTHSTTSHSPKYTLLCASPRVLFFGVAFCFSTGAHARRAQTLSLESRLVKTRSAGRLACSPLLHVDVGEGTIKLNVDVRRLAGLVQQRCSEVSAADAGGILEERG